jgi:hypothetical protein
MGEAAPTSFLCSRKCRETSRQVLPVQFANMCPALVGEEAKKSVAARAILDCTLRLKLGCDPALLMRSLHPTP